MNGNGNYNPNGYATLGRPPLGAVSLGAQADGSTDDANLKAAGDAVQAIDPCVPLINPTVHAFQVAWNSTTDEAFGNPHLVPDGKYGPKTAAALGSIYGNQSVQVQGPCPQFAGGGTPSPHPSPNPTPTPIVPVTPPGALSTTTKWLLGGLIAVAVLALGWVLMHPKHRAKRAARRHARHAAHHTAHHAHETPRRRRRHGKRRH
jgi:hypothetical protein